jgi:hypothetical protein
VQEKFKLVQPWLTLLARLILGGVLIVAGALKVGNLQKSAMSVRAYEMLPIWLANFLVMPYLGLKLVLVLC